jgi:hypothetical protein
MHIPLLRGTIARRILLNYRIDAAVAARCLPAPFRPQILGGFALGGVCLLRLERLRPSVLPAVAGLASEGAAHRFAVEWDGEHGPRRGVYIPRRDTSSWLNAAAGGRLFPGEHHRARFEIGERDGGYRLVMKSDDGKVRVALSARPAAAIAAGSVFGSLDEARRFFEEGCVSCSDTRVPGEFDALELRCPAFHLAPLEVDEVSSSFFDDPRLFPPGSVTFDSGFLMRRVEHSFHGRGRVRAETSADAA